MTTSINEYRAHRLSVRDLSLIALVTAMTAVMAQISIPMPGGVPLTLQTLAVSLAGILLGAKRGTVSMLVYLLLGAVGVPVFAGFTGGATILFGSTGGFLLSFPLMAFVIGCGAPYLTTRKARYILFLVLGTALNYVCGMLLFSLLTGSGLGQAFTACVLPFLPTTIIKAIVATMIGSRVRRGVGNL